MHSCRALVRSVLLTSALGLLAACNSGTSESPTPEASAPTASPAAAEASPASTAAEASPAASSASTASAASDAGATAPPPPVGLPAGPPPELDKDYTVLDTPEQPSGDKVQVTEVFGYGCPHCNALQPHLSAWEKKLPSDVQFTYLPAAFGPGPAHCWDEFARGFYSAQAMGVPLAKSHDAVYRAVWDQHRFNDCSDIPKIFADFGLDPQVFSSTMQSFAINAKLGNAHDQEMRWGINGTPTVVVDGKYLVGAAVPDTMLHTIDWLIAKQRPLHAKH